MGKTTSFYFLLGSLCLFLLFQNCSGQLPFTQTSKNSESETQAPPPDGQVFDGKLRIVHHIIDGFTCEGRLAPESILVRVSDTSWQWTQNKVDKCAAAEMAVDASLVNYNEATKTATYDGKIYVPPRPYNVSASANPNSPDTDILDGVCENASGQCSLTAAVQQAAPTSLTAPVIVRVPSGSFNLTKTLEVKLLAESQAVRIEGAGMGNTILDGGGDTVHFYINSRSNSLVSISKMTLQRGFDPLAIYAASIQITTSPRLQPHPDDKFPDAQVSINDCEFRDNSNGDVIWAAPNHGSLQVHRSKFLNNQATAIWAESTNGLLVSDSEFSSNSGRAIVVNGNTKPVLIRNSSFSNNYEAISLFSCSQCSIENSTIYRNPAGGLVISTMQYNPNYDVTIRQSTFFDNATAPIAGQYRSNIKSLIQGAGNKIFMSNSIVAISSTGTSPNCSNYPWAFLEIVGDNNLVTDSSCNIVGANNLIANPLLGAPALNGGFTTTFLPQLGSPVIDAGSNALCTPQDQRGFARPVNARCDIGAVEVQ